MIGSAASSYEEPAPRQRGGVRTFKGTRTPMSNAPISGRANGTPKEHESWAARAPLHWDVRQRVVADAAAPSCRAFRDRGVACPPSGARQLMALCGQADQRGGAVPCQDRIRRCLTLDITGPPSGTHSMHENCAAAAPVHVVVRCASSNNYSLVF